MFSHKPKRMSVIVRRADELARRGQTDKAITELNKALTQDPNSPATRLRKAELLVRSGERVKACHLYESLAVHYNQKGFYSQAISMFKQAVGQCPERIDLMEKVAELYLKRGIQKEASLMLRAAALACERAGKVDAQMKFLDRLVQLGDASLKEQHALADFHATRGDSVSALELFERVKEALSAAGREAEREQIERRIKAIKGIQRIRATQLLKASQQELKQQPDSPAALVKKGDSLAALGRTEEAISSYLKAAQGYYSQGGYLPAIAACDKLLNLDMYHTEAYLLQINAREKAGLDTHVTPVDELTDGLEIHVKPDPDYQTNQGESLPSSWEARVSIPVKDEDPEIFWELSIVPEG